MIRARFQTNIVSLMPTITVKVEYDTTIPPAPSATTAPAVGANWDVARWDIDTWGGAPVSHTEAWIPTYADASQVAPVVQLSVKTTATPDARLTSIDVLFETGSIFG
jgi:hypothetical protein